MQDEGDRCRGSPGRHGRRGGQRSTNPSTQSTSSAAGGAGAGGGAGAADIPETGRSHRVGRAVLVPPAPRQEVQTVAGRAASLPGEDRVVGGIGSRGHLRSSRRSGSRTRSAALAADRGSVGARVGAGGRRRRGVKSPPAAVVGPAEGGGADRCPELAVRARAPRAGSARRRLLDLDAKDASAAGATVISGFARTGSRAR